MPSLQPESPDGFFVFLIQMGMAQREVDVLAKRTPGGVEAKMRAGGWPHKAPEGYVNIDRPLGSNKYERRAEQDPEDIQGIKLAWELLLTDRYTLTGICEELAAKGVTRASGLPWVWDDPKSGKRKTAHNTLHKLFYSPFYAGWATSKRFGIKVGEVRGIWEPFVSTEEFEKGKQILLKHGDNKADFKKQYYLLRNLLYIKTTGRTLKMYGSTPAAGSKRKISYYRSIVDIEGKKLRLLTTIVDDQIPELIEGTAIDPALIPAIKEKYQAEIKSQTQDDKTGSLERMKNRLVYLEKEEAHLARLFMTSKINEQTYNQLRQEWVEKTRSIQASIKELEMDVR